MKTEQSKVKIRRIERIIGFFLFLAFFLNLNDVYAAQNTYDCDCSPEAIKGSCNAGIRQSGNWIYITSDPGQECKKVFWYADEAPHTSVLIKGKSIEEWGGIVNKEPQLSIDSCRVCKDLTKEKKKKDDTTSQRTKDQFRESLDADGADSNPPENAPSANDEMASKHGKDRFVDMLESTENGNAQQATPPDAAPAPATAEDLALQANVEAMKRKLEQTKVTAEMERQQSEIKAKELEAKSQEAHAKYEEAKARSDQLEREGSSGGGFGKALGIILQGVATGVQTYNSVNAIKGATSIPTIPVPSGGTTSPPTSGYSGGGSQPSSGGSQPYNDWQDRSNDPCHGVRPCSQR